MKSGRYDQVWVFPTKQNPFKAQSSSFADRKEMCRLAFAGLDPRIQVRGDEESLTGFTIDLVRHLKALHPNDRFTFIGGSDLAKELPRWEKSEELKKLLNFEFLPRPPDPDSPFPPIRATEIRERIRRGTTTEGLLTPEVAAFIAQRGLYRDS